MYGNNRMMGQQGMPSMATGAAQQPQMATMPRIRAPQQQGAPQASMGMPQQGQPQGQPQGMSSGQMMAQPQLSREEISKMLGTMLQRGTGGY